MAEQFSNNAVSTLTGSLAAIGTSLTVQAGHGARFPTPGASDFFRLVLVRKSDGAYEIVFCTVRSGDIFTITRAQESTTALAFVASDIVELRPTAGFFTSLTVTSSAIQNNQYTYDATDTGSANICIIQPSPAITTYTEGQEFWWKVGVTNTGPSTLNVSALGTSPAIIMPNGSALYAGVLQATRIAHTIFDGTAHVLQNPSVLPSTPGTVEAFKAVVVDGSKNISSFNNLTLAGTLNAGAITNLGATINGDTSLEIGYVGGVARTTIVDFHTGATAVDYDSRISANGGTGSIGGGNITLTAATINLTGTIPTANITTVNVTGVLTAGASVVVNPTVNSATVFEIGYTGGVAQVTRFDFHTGATAVDRDSYIQASGGNGANDGGTIEIKAATISLTGQIPAVVLGVTAGNTVIYRVVGEGNTTTVETVYMTVTTTHYVQGRVLPIRCLANGTIRINLEQLSANAAATSSVRIVKNESATPEVEWTTTSTSIVSRTQDVSVAIGDVVCIHQKTNNSLYSSIIQRCTVSASTLTVAVC